MIDDKGPTWPQNDALERAKQIRERVAELEAEVKRLVAEHEVLTGGRWQKPDGDDMVWATGGVEPPRPRVWVD